MNITNQIKAINWDKRVTRTGFIQSKHICSEACIIPLQLTTSVTAKYDNQIWVTDLALYDEDATSSFFELFDKAFLENPNWPVVHAQNLEKQKKELDKFRLAKKDPIKTFNDYVQLLHAIQKYYVIAVPLTNYCEKRLREQGINAEKFGQTYFELDVSALYNSLRSIKTEEDIKQHLKKFGWIKTAYNIVEEYTIEEVQEQLKHGVPKQEVRTESKDPIIVGLQVGIYLRNRMKELSQQVWYDFEKTALQLAAQLNITRDEFFMHTHQEILAALSGSELKKRSTPYVVGCLHSKNVLLFGREAEELEKYCSTIAQDSKIIKGMTACNGEAKGTARIIRNRADFSKFNQGDILVTSMTTPDFVVIMKKAAAIVTDEGGLSCHAAIVSRELNVPCIIGTQNATTSINDGEIIFVEATKGVIRREL